MRDMMRDAPTFRPTKAEMADFSAYVSKIMPQAAEFGICKVVPPKSWEGPPTTAPPDDLVIRGAIQQHAMGSHGAYSIVNQVQKQSMSFERFSRQAESFEARSGCRQTQPSMPSRTSSGRSSSASSGVHRCMAPTLTAVSLIARLTTSTSTY